MRLAVLPFLFLVAAGCSTGSRLPQPSGEPLIGAPPEIPDGRGYWEKLASPRMLLAGNEPISADLGHAAPAVIDINRDGRKDLLVGQFRGGNCRVYINRGTDARPQFSRYYILSTPRGGPINVDYG